MSADKNLDLMDEATGSIIIPQNVTKIGNGAFRDVEGLRSIVIPGTVKEIGEHAFSGNSTLENVVIEEGVEKIGPFAFQSCSALKSIKIADSVSYIGSTCFGSCITLTEINFPKSLKTVPYRMLSNCGSLTEIDISEGIEIIEGNAFEYCNLNKVKIPSTVTSLDGSAFVRNYNLTNIEISPNNNSYKFSNGFLMSKDGKSLLFIVGNLTEINIPNTVETIGAGVFDRTPQRATVNISRNVKKISSVFGPSITKINVVEDNDYFKSDNGNLYNKDMTIIKRYTQNETSFIMPDTVKVISQYAFSDNGKLTQLTLSRDLEKIDVYAFYRTSIKKLDIPAKVNSINGGSFIGPNIDLAISDENPNIKTEDGTIVLSKDGKRLITTSKNLETYNIPSSVEVICRTAFYTKDNLKEIIIPENVKTIESGAFDNSSLQKIEISSGIQSIGNSAFSRCNSLREIIIDKKENSISDAPWSCPYGLRAVFWKS